MLDVLIVPAAGTSSRFPGTRPKWLLTHPDGRIMGAAALDGLPRARDMIVVTSKEIAQKYGEEPIRKAFLDGMERTPQRKMKLLVVKQTPHQPATIAAAVSLIAGKRSIMIKDTDNTFRFDEEPQAGMNAVATADIHAGPIFNSLNKCYLKYANGEIFQAVERQAVSNRFACGLYSFERADVFKTALESIWSADRALYPSDVINALLDVGKQFVDLKARDYQDWGTLPDWIRFKLSWRTLFIDVDGVLFKNGSEHFKPFWEECPPITPNVAALVRLRATGRARIVLTTARPTKERFRLETQLKKAGVPYDDLIMGLYHAPRYLVNDYTATNPYPSAQAINIVRDSDDLNAMLHGVMKDY